MLAEGHTVEVVAPDPVATAHRYLSVRGIPGCLQLATMVSGFDSVVVQLQAGPAGAGDVRDGWSARCLLFAFSFALRPCPPGRDPPRVHWTTFPAARAAARPSRSGAAPSGSWSETTISAPSSVAEVGQRAERLRRELCSS